MTAERYRAIRMAISSLTSGLIAAGSILLTGITSDHALTQTAILVAVITGILQMLTNFQAYISTPPGGAAPALTENVSES